MRNASDDIHPIHLHRHSFELTNICGKPTSGVFKDVVMLGGYQETQIDFVADNPGLTLFHCHQQLHMDFGFMTLVRLRVIFTCSSPSTELGGNYSSGAHAISSLEGRILGRGHSNRTGGSAARTTAKGRASSPITISAPARIRASRPAKLRVASASEMWMTSFAIEETMSPGAPSPRDFCIRAFPYTTSAARLE